MCAVVQSAFWRCPLQFTDAKSHSRQRLMHMPQVPKADVHQLFLTSGNDINSLLETDERYKGTERPSFDLKEDGMCISVKNVLLECFRPLLSQ